MSAKDIRWKHRFSNYLKALNQLKNAAELAKKRDLTDLEQQGLIQSFEYTHELAWNVMKDYAHYQGSVDVAGSRDATREAFQLNLIEDGTNWMEMISSRNKTSHTYNEEVAKEIVSNILNTYYPLFLEFRDLMEGKLSEDDDSQF